MVLLHRPLSCSLRFRDTPGINPSTASSVVPRRYWYIKTQTNFSKARKGSRKQPRTIMGKAWALCALMALASLSSARSDETRTLTSCNAARCKFRVAGVYKNTHSSGYWFSPEKADSDSNRHAGLFPTPFFDVGRVLQSPI